MEEELGAEDDPQDDDDEADKIAPEARKFRTAKADAVIVVGWIVEEEIQDMLRRLGIVNI